MTKDEFWEAINTGGKVYTYNDALLCADSKGAVHLYYLDSDEVIKVANTFDEMLDKSTILGKPLVECLTQIEC